MSSLLVIPVSQKYIDLTNEINETLKNPKAKPQSKQAAKVTSLFIEEILQALVFDLVEDVGFKPFAKKLILNVGNIVQKAIQLLVDKIIVKLDNKELTPYIQHFTKLQYKDGDQNYVGVELSSEQEQRLEDCWEDLASGNISNTSKELKIFLQGSLDVSLDAYLKTPMSLVRLGLISGKILDGVYLAIDKAVPPAIKKVVDGMDDQELEEFKDFFEKMILKN